MKYTYYETENMCVITDTHFGRKFKEGIPLDRRGEYEESVFKDFENFMFGCDSDIVVHAGDLFDSPFVSNEVLMRVFTTIWVAAKRHPKTSYYFIAGNHDLSKNKEESFYTSFYVLETLLSNEFNVRFIHFEADYADANYKILLVPYSHFETADEMINKKLKEETTCIIGHFDDPVPSALVNFNGTKLSGHFHKKHLTSDGTLFIGSFYPIAFGEESDDSVMETMTLEEYNKHSEEELKDKRIRLLLKEGEELPNEFPCLQLIGKKEKSEGVDLEVKSDTDFDFKELFFKCTEKSGISDELWYKYLSLKGNN